MIAVLPFRYDRRQDFVIDDAANLGVAAFKATKSMKVNSVSGRRGGGRVNVTAVAIRDRGTVKFSKIIRFGFSLPGPLDAKLQCWIAVPRGASRNFNSLFLHTTSEGKLIPPNEEERTQPRGRIESWLLEKCTVLTLAQRSADWFCLRKFRLTGTIAASVLLRANSIRYAVGLPPIPHANQRQDPNDLFSKLFSSWLSTSRSSEAMIRGTMNEAAIFAAIQKQPYVVVIFECGMFASSSLPYLACSPDAIAIVSTGDEMVIASVEFKSSISSTSRDRILSMATMELQRCTIGDENFIRLIPEEHIGQLLQQMVVLAVQYLLYVAASESGIAYVVLVQCTGTLLQECQQVLETACRETVAWLHEETVQFPSFVKGAVRRIIKTHLPLWKLVTNRVTGEAPFPPLKLFKHGVQLFYSKTKCGVDGSAQARAVLRSPVSSVAWEQKIVSQTLKTLAVNAFVAYRMTARRDAVQSKESFGTLLTYRNRLNKVRASCQPMFCISLILIVVRVQVESLGDFIADVVPELLTYAKQLEQRRVQLDDESFEQRASVRRDSSSDVRELIRKAMARKSQRLVWFQSPEGISLRLLYDNHTNSNCHLIFTISE